MTEVLGADGTLMVSGNTDLVYLVDTTPNSDNPNISDYAALDPYKAVGINGTTLHVSLNGAPEASRNGDGLKVSNLVGSDGALTVTNTADDAASNHAVVDLVQDVDAGGNSYGGGNRGGYQQGTRPAPSSAIGDGFMNIPDGVEDEGLPFN